MLFEILVLFDLCNFWYICVYLIWTGNYVSYKNVNFLDWKLYYRFKFLTLLWKLFWLDMDYKARET